MTLLRQIAVILVLGCCAATAGAGLFDDEEARKAILDLRQKLDAVRSLTEQGASRAADDSAGLRRSLLDLQNQIELLRAEAARLRGMNEQLSRDLAEVQRRQKDITQGVDERLRQFEPLKVSLDGRDFMAQPGEKRDFEAALAVFRKGDFAASQPLFIGLLQRYPHSGYAASALFWLGNAQYATRDYPEAMINFRSQLARDAEHPRSSEALLSIANCQIEMKDTRGARKTLEDLLKAYPQSEAAGVAKERLVRLK